MPVIVVPAKDWANEIVRKIPRHLDGDSHSCRRNGRSGRCNEQDAAKQVPVGRNDGKRMQDAALRQTCGDKPYRSELPSNASCEPLAKSMRHGCYQSCDETHPAQRDPKAQSCKEE